MLSHHETQVLQICKSEAPPVLWTPTISPGKLLLHGLHLHTGTWYTLIFYAAVISASWPLLNPVRLLQTVCMFCLCFTNLTGKMRFQCVRSSCVSGCWNKCIKPLVLWVMAHWDVTCGPLSVWSASFLESSQIHCLALLLPQEARPESLLSQLIMLINFFL